MSDEALDQVIELTFKLTIAEQAKLLERVAAHLAREIEPAEADAPDHVAEPAAGKSQAPSKTKPNKSALEQQFDEAMLQVYKDAKRECHYNATYFLQMVNERGGLATARYLITTDSPSEGFTRLWECKRLDLTVEAVALDPKYASLFTKEELGLARDRLREYGYEPHY